MCFWTVAGHGLYWPSLITVWHREPGGNDSGEVCSRSSWIWHVHHWKIQVHPLQDLRRRLLTRCEECGRKGRPNVSHQWDREPGHWWRGERGLYHRECSSLIELRRIRDYDETLIWALVSEILDRSGETPKEFGERFTGYNASLPFHLRYRLGRILKPKDGE